MWLLFAEFVKFNRNYIENFINETAIDLYYSWYGDSGPTVHFRSRFIRAF